jgi:DNA-binding transcriptional LysR family regulator
MIDLRQIRYFAALAEELHFGRAAERLRIAQPALTQQMQRLERDLGVVLIDRSRRRVQLTAAGEVLLEEGRRVLAQVERAVTLTRRAGRGEVGRLVIGASESASYGVLPELLREYRRDFPAVDLSVRLMTTPAQVEAVKSGEIDVGLARSPMDAGGLACRTIRVDPLAVLLPEEHPLAQEPEIALGQMEGVPLVVHPAAQRPSWVDFMLSVLRDAGVEPGPVQEASDTMAAVAFVAAGLGVTLVPGASGQFARPGVVWRPLAEPAPQTRLVLLHRSERLPATVTALLGVVERLWPEPDGAAGESADG